MMNANNPMTPGVYTVEKNGFPDSVAEVPTAIPAFIGYTEKAFKNGKPITEPTLVNSLKEYEEYFGGAFTFQYPIMPTESKTRYDFSVSNKNYNVGTPGAGKLFYLYNCLQWFYQNGGGPCYIVPVKPYEVNGVNTQPSKDDFLDGLALLPKVPFPKPTMILMPDALLLSSNDYFTVQQQALLQCGELQDRVALIDIPDGDTSNADTGVIDSFRNKIGNTYLKYGITYYPFLKTTIVGASDVTYANVDQSKEATDNGAKTLAQLFPGEKALPSLKAITEDCKNVQKLTGPPALDLNSPPKAPIDSSGTAAVEYPSWSTAYNAFPNSLTPEGILKWKAATIGSMAAVLYGVGTADGLKDPEVKLEDSELLKGVANLLNSKGYLASLLAKLAAVDKGYTSGAWGVITEAFLASIKVTTTIPSLTGVDQTMANNTLDQTFKAFNTAVGQVYTMATTLLDQYNSSLEGSNANYKNVMLAIAEKAGILPPCSAMAGMYTLVDNTEGVWTSPANRNIFSATGPTVTIDDDSQASLNVDALAGKSINAIRSFYGRGPAIVWGARTLDGNSQDWRYINVRRTMIMIEQSVANAAFDLVFESNDDATWTTCTSMISNFLYDLWAEGALQGASAEDAYSVAVGLGKTMTPEDILNGIMRVQVKVAVVRPAEFIIITYEQQMAKS